MQILSLPLGGFYSIRARNGYGPHLARPCKVVLPTLVEPMGVTCPNLSRNTYRTLANGLS